MKICFVLSDIATEYAGTSMVLIKKAFERGHTVYVMGVGGFNFVHGKPLRLSCKKIPKNFEYKDEVEFLEKLQQDKIKYKDIDTEKLDVLFLRNNPTEEPKHRKWAEHSGIAFARMIQKQGVIVLNDADAMAHSFIDKLYFEELPPEIKPDSLITRSRDEVLKFWERVGKKMVLKPLEGSGGQSIYLIDKDKKNFNQIIDNLLEKGYIIAQEFLPEVSKGDVRVLVMNGKILEEDGELALIRRKNDDKEEFRSNLALGAKPEKAKLTPEIEKIVNLTAPKLKRDGFFFVGLDVVDDKLIEINVMSPGGLHYCPKIGLPEFTDTVIKSIERKVEYKASYDKEFSNKELASLE